MKKLRSCGVEHILLGLALLLTIISGAVLIEAEQESEQFEIEEDGKRR